MKKRGIKKMTTQKIIDNIQTRLENLVSERFSGSYQQIDISCSNYNPTIDSNITITITVTDESGTPISGLSVPLKIDGTSISGVTTNSSGVATHTYNCTDWGNHKISVKSVSTFINVTGWKTFTNTSDYTVKYNKDFVRVDVHIPTSKTFTGSWTDWASILSSSPQLRPAMPIVFMDMSGSILAKLRDNDDRIGFKTVSGSSVSSTFYGSVTYARK